MTKQNETTTEETTQTGAEHTAEDGTQQADAGTETVTEEIPAETETDQQTDEAAGDKGRLTPEAQAILNKRIGKEVAKTKDLQTKLSDAETELAKTKTAVEGNIPLHTDWIGKDELALIQQANALETEIAELKRHYKDGIEDTDHPENSKTPEEVQQRYAAATAELAGMKDRANTAYKAAQKQFVDDALAGRKLREQKADAARKASDAAATTTTKPTPGTSPLKSGAVKPAGTTTTKPGAKATPGQPRTAMQLMADIGS